MSYTYSEKTDIGEISVENKIYFWDNCIDIFQIASIGDMETVANISMDKDHAIRYANMILEFYKDAPE